MESKFYGRKNYLSELDALLAKVTLDDVNNAMKKYWQTKICTSPLLLINRSRTAGKKPESQPAISDELFQTC
jgi:hypothetical protein